MDSLIAFLPFALILLACPLMMVGMGVAVWVWARVRGQKKEFSMCGMGSSCNHEDHRMESADAVPGPQLRDEVVRLQREVSALRSQVTGSRAPEASGPAGVGQSTRSAAVDE